MVLSSKNSAFFSDVCRVFDPPELRPSPPKYRIGCSRRFSSGRLSRRGRIRAIKTLKESAYIYKTMSGRSGWPSRDPIGERGGVNLYGFVGNNPITGIDLFGLYDVDKKARIVKVEKCEIVILYGHQNPKKPWKFEFPSSCSAGGALVCYPGRSNSEILPEHQIPGMPTHDDIIWFYGENPSDATEAYREDRGPETDFSKLFPNARRNAFKRAMDLCRQNCCEKVVIRYYRNASNWGSDKKLIPQPPEEEVIDCSRVRKKN